MADDKSNEGFLRQAGHIISAVVGKVMQDGTIAAAGRMGLDELGEALKPFPDSVQQQESGGIWNPTQGEVAKARAEPAPQLVSLGKAARLPSPSEIAVETRPYQPQAGQDPQREHGR